MTPSKSQARPTSDGVAPTNGKQASGAGAEPASSARSAGAKKSTKAPVPAPKGASPAAKAGSSGAKGSRKAPASKGAAGGGRAKAPVAPTPAGEARGTGRARHDVGSAVPAPAPPEDGPGTRTAAPHEERPAARPAPAKPYVDDTRFLQEQRELLDTERSVYKGQAADLKAEADSLAEDREPGDVQFDEESGEGGTVTVDRERDLALSAQALAAVEEIDEAVERIELGTYGACERCHQPIPKSRLRALPFARLCVACKSGGLSRR